MNSGHVRVYDFNGTSWVQAGSDIDGEAAGDQSGYSVSLSSDGSRLAIGAIENDGGGDQSGHIRIYEFKSGAWSQVGTDINGGASGDNLGRSVSISSDGSRVAIGGNGNDGNGTNSGFVRVHGLPSSGSNYQYVWDVDNPNAPSDGVYIAGVAGSDLAGNAYSGTDSITLQLIPPVSYTHLTLPTKRIV